MNQRSNELKNGSTHGCPSRFVSERFNYSKRWCQMERYIAMVVGMVGASISFLVDGLGEAVVVLLFMMALDYISGLMSAIYVRKLNSRIGFNGLIRKSYYLLLLGSVYLMGTVVEGISYAGDGLAIALIVMEFVSIVENGTKLNLPIPEPVKRVLLIVKGKVEKEITK